MRPSDESTLNNLGIYHFDQIAAWDEREVLWLENHAFARGRIGREDWQEQARELQAGGDEIVRRGALQNAALGGFARAGDLPDEVDDRLHVVDIVEQCRRAL